MSDDLIYVQIHCHYIYRYLVIGLNFTEMKKTYELRIDIKPYLKIHVVFYRKEIRVKLTSSQCLMFQFNKWGLNLLYISIQIAHSYHIRGIAFLWYSRAVGNNTRVLPSLNIDFQSQGRGCVFTWIFKCWLDCVWSRLCMVR